MPLDRTVDAAFIDDFMYVMKYNREVFNWGDKEQKEFSKFIDDLLSLGYKIAVVEYFHEEAVRLKKVRIEAKMAIHRAKRK